MDEKKKRSLKEGEEEEEVEEESLAISSESSWLGGESVVEKGEKPSLKRSHQMQTARKRTTQYSTVEQDDENNDHDGIEIEVRTKRMRNYATKRTAALREADYSSDSVVVLDNEAAEEAKVVVNDDIIESSASSTSEFEEASNNNNNNKVKMSQTARKSTSQIRRPSDDSASNKRKSNRTTTGANVAKKSTSNSSFLDTDEYCGDTESVISDEPYVVTESIEEEEQTHLVKNANYAKKSTAQYRRF